MERVAAQPNERVDISDYEAGAGGANAHLDQLREAAVKLLPDGRTTGAAATAARILGGFDFSTINLGVDGTATLNRGRGILPYWDPTNVRKFGVLFGNEGAASTILDFSTALAGSTQAVYVRVLSTPATFQNRVFWNPSAGPAREQIDNIATRLVLTWEVEFRNTLSSPPGNGEWVKIWDVTLDGGNLITAVTDFRDFYFEGDVSGSYAHEWGDGTNDRNVDRATYGIQDDHMWAQAIRRQLSDVVGLGAWYKAAPANLQDLRRIHTRFTTVDKPGGPGGDGTYATVSAAVTALNAADGGTILLQAGNYNITAMPATISKRINIIAVDGAAVLVNKINANLFMFNFDAGAEGSLLRHIQVSDHATDSSEKVIQTVGAVPIILECCSLQGEVRVDAGQLYAYASTFQDSVEIDFSTRLVHITGAGVKVKFSICTFIGGTNIGRASTVVITGVSPFVGDLRSNITFDHCDWVVPQTGTGSLSVTSTSYADITAADCTWLCNPPDDLTRVIHISGGNTTIRGGSIHVANSGDNFRNNLIKVNSTSDVERALIEGLHVNCNGIVHEMPSYDQTAFHFAGKHVTVRDMQVWNIMLPDSSIQASAFSYMLLDPPVGGQVDVLHCEFYNIENTGVNDIAVHVLGQNATATGAGRIRIQDSTFDGGLNVYTSAGSQSAFIRVSGAAQGLMINHNYFTGGVFTWAVRLTVGGVTMCNNDFIFTSTPGIGFSQIVNITGINAVGKEGYCIFSGNTGLTDLTTGTLSPYEISTFYKILAVGNSYFTTSAAVPTDGGLYMHDSTNLTAHSNSIDWATTSAAISGTQRPTVLADQNI